MLKIETESNGSGRVIRLIGRIRAEHIETLETQLSHGDSPANLDLREVTIVDLKVVQFLVNCESNGIRLQNCPLYVREWIVREQSARSR
jgi:anti-anti-sigma regulatory factor